MNTADLFKERSAVRRLIALLGTIGLCLGIMTLTPIAQASNGAAQAPNSATDAKKPGPPAKPKSPEVAPACTLTDPDSPNSEWATCVVADVEFLGAPDSDGNATAELTVTSQEDISDAVVSVSLNQNLSMVSAPGFGNLKSSVSGVGPVSTLSQSVDLTAGATQTFRFDVRAAAKGYATIQARVKTGDARTNAVDETTYAARWGLPIRRRRGLHRSPRRSGPLGRSVRGP